MGPSVARVAGTGVLGLDPAGAVVALTAVTLGAGRRALSALVVSYYVTIVCLGVGATYATRMLSGTDTVRRWTAFGRVHHLLGLAECAVGALLVIAAAALWWRAGHPRGVEPPPAAEPDTATTGRLGTPRALAAAGVALAASLVVDPAFAVMTVSLSGASGWAMVSDWVLWASISQAPMLVLWATVLAARRGPFRDRVTGALRRGLAHSGAALRIAMVVVAVVLLRSGVHRLGMAAAGGG